MLFKVMIICLGTICCFGSELIEKMSLEEKVGQVLMVHCRGEVVGDDAKTLVQDVKVGGIIYYNWANGLTSPEQVRALSLSFQKLAMENRHAIPLLIAADQEGGIVARLQSGFTQFPGNRALGETGNPNLAEEAAFAIGQELQSVGINMNLAPVVDVNSNPKNPVIGVRSFGEEPEIVAAFGEKSLAGFKQAGIVATLKHFPGHGDTAIDSHEDLPIVHKSLTELKQMELFPFAKLASSADAIMTAHILVPALDPQNCSTLSEKTLSYLREEIGFQGVIVADSLIMGGILKNHSVDEASILALNAGCDLLILGGRLLEGERTGLELTVADIQRIHGAIVQAVKDGTLSEAKLDQALERVLKLKRHSAPTDLQNSSAHFALAQKIASSALKIKENNAQILPLTDKKICLIAPEILRKNLLETSIFKMGKSVEGCFFSTLNPSKEEVEAIQKRAKMSDVIIVCSYNAWKNPSAIALTESLLKGEKPLILLSLRDPLDASLFSDAGLIFTSFSPTIPSIQAICDQLMD